MYKAVWDTGTGGVTLQNYKSDETLSVSPRPVFYEELDLLGLDKLPEGKAWHYPHSKEPLLWACNKQYFYKGAFVFEAKGANLYDSATIVLQPGAEGLTLEPVNVKEMLERCKDAMFHIESEAIEFIRSTYEQYSRNRLVREKAKANQIDFEALAAKVEKTQKKKMAIVKEDCESFDIMPMELAKDAGKQIYQTTAKIDVFLASFSGGKDSQVVLDLCTRALPPEAFQVIYSDTGYELPTSLSLYKEVQRYYRKKFPTLQFRLAKNHESVLNYWDQIGTPSDTHRWCCTVMKTAPLYRMLKVDGTNKQARVLTFDGVRAEESTRRSTYSRIGKGVKHDTVINASPILDWSSIQIFLYLFEYNLPINIAYRQGMTRVGCLICPFSSEWNEMIARQKYNEPLQPFLDRLTTFTNHAGIKDVEEYIKSGNWKRRAGGRDIQSKTRLQVIKTRPDLVIKVYSPKQDIFTFLRAVGKFTIEKVSESRFSGEIRYKSDIFAIEAEVAKDEFTITLANSFKEPLLQGLFRRAITKGCYCIQCEGCEVECPTGALSILPTPKIDGASCISCHKCLMFHEKGCIVAHSLAETETKDNKMKLVSYNNFGLKEEWLDLYMSDPEYFFKDESNGLNKKEQEPNFAKWIAQAGIIDDANPAQRNLTNLGCLLRNAYQDNPDFVWEVIWINLTYNAPIAKWYKENVTWDSAFTQVDIAEQVKMDYPDTAAKSIGNIVYALFRTFRESPIGEWGLLTEIDKLRYRKNGYNAVSRSAIAYSMYKMADETGIRTFRVSNLYSGDALRGPYKEFGLSKKTFEGLLLSLNNDANRLLTAELQMGLDHITLRDDLTAEKVLELLTK